MTEEPELEARVAALEKRMEKAEADAAAARHLAAANDRDLSEFAIKIDANRQAINALGEQTAAGLAQVRSDVSEVRSEVRAGFEAIGTKLDTLIERDAGDA